MVDLETSFETSKDVWWGWGGVGCANFEGLDLIIFIMLYLRFVRGISFSGPLRADLAPNIAFTFATTPPSLLSPHNGSSISR